MSKRVGPDVWVPSQVCNMLRDVLIILRVEDGPVEYGCIQPILANRPHVLSCDKVCLQFHPYLAFHNAKVPIGIFTRRIYSRSCSLLVLFLHKKGALSRFLLF